MAFTKCNVPDNIIGNLGTTVTDRGLTTQEFKDKFDEGVEGIKEYLNDTLTEELDPFKDDYDSHKSNDTNAHGIDTLISDVSDHSQQITALENSFHSDLEAWYGNTKLIDDFQSLTGWTYGASVTSDTTNVKIGNSSIRLTEMDNSAGWLSFEKNNISFNLAKLNNGEDSGLDDYIRVVFVLSDLTLTTSNLQVAFSTGATYDISNNAYYNMTLAPLVADWNYVDIQKSAFTIMGSFDWSEVKSIRIGISTNENKQNEYISFQLIQLVKKDPLSAYPNPFQRFGVRDFNPAYREWFVGYENNGIVCKYLQDASGGYQRSLFGETNFKNFIIFETVMVPSSSYAYGPEWHIDANNRVYLRIEGNNMELTAFENGSQTSLLTKALTVNAYDRISFRLEKTQDKVFATVINLSTGKSASLQTSLTLLTDSSGVLVALVRNSQVSYLEAISITTLGHAATASKSDTADVSNKLAIKYKAGAFTASELSFGELGIDTTNNRIYMLKNATTVYYASLT